MWIPNAWAKATGEATSRDGRRLALRVWGTGKDARDAERDAAQRLERVHARVRRGEPLPSGYAYGERPLREEIIERMTDADTGELYAAITRNRYGALILNTTRLLFLDIDLARMNLGARLRWLLTAGRADPARPALAALREALRGYGRASFRLYRTAGGFRAIAVDREFDPAARDTRELMQRTGTDPAYMRLCHAQRSFRARLTPKPWRAECPLPPGLFPRSDEKLQKRFASWLRRYESARAHYASCRYLETIGGGRPSTRNSHLIELHDRTCGVGESLNLA
jgi:hypothetical protein